MNRLKEGQRVFDTDSGEFGTVLQYISNQTVAVEYDHDLGCKLFVCEVCVDVLEMVNSK